VGLEASEIERARRRLRVIASGASFEQPCAALVGDAERGSPGPDAFGARTCAIYDERPRACARFTCRLYERHRSEGGPLEPRLAAVRRVRELVARVDPSDLDELARRIEDDFARA
jgi:hypothetical protein